MTNDAIRAALARIVSEIEARADCAVGPEGRALDEALSHAQAALDEIGAACRAVENAPAYVPPSAGEIARMFQITAE